MARRFQLLRTATRLSCLALAATSVSETTAAMDDRNKPRIAPARDGNIAIREELDAARRARTLAAYDLFIARHPRHPLVRIARDERRKLAGRLGRR